MIGFLFLQMILVWYGGAAALVLNALIVGPDWIRALAAVMVTECAMVGVLLVTVGWHAITD